MTVQSQRYGVTTRFQGNLTTAQSKPIFKWEHDVSAMTKTGAIRCSGAIACLILLAGMAHPQNFQPEESLGDVAKEQREQHPKETKPAPKKVYRNRDVVTEQDSPAPESQQTTSQEITAQKTGSAQAQNSPIQKASSRPATTSIFDRKDDDPAADFILVPAGTQIEVNMMDSNVAMPVRIRFATPIPALSKVALKVFVVDEGYNYYDYAPELGNFATLSSVTIGDVTYPVQSDTVPYATGEQIFTLSEPLRIKR